MDIVSPIFINMFALILVLFLAQNALGNGVGNVDCEQRSYSVCSPGRRGATFPGSEDDLNTVCPEIIEYAECLNTYDEVCATKEEDVREFKPGQYVKIRELLADICNNNSLLHKVLSENMRCIKESIDGAGDECAQKRYLFRKTYMSQREVDEESASFEELVNLHCLLPYQMMSCVIGDISRRCGDMAKSAVIEVAFRANILQSDRCPAEHFSGMVGIVNDLELPAEQKEEILHLISSYSAYSSERK
ncbi:uncharacterized protein LOC129226513 [Uloborus diversus]|uniref:uncharacterized protein LOC129226513 n=1 Tax=Uloborus diversus TaxID=327109 RepID=UPI0024094B93|nr:uncharacterized protein LOC129226513 [Uloborus diversus]